MSVVQKLGVLRKNTVIHTEGDMTFRVEKGTIVVVSSDTNTIVPLSTLKSRSSVCITVFLRRTPSFCTTLMHILQKRVTSS